MNPDKTSYESALALLADEQPRLASALQQAEKQRARHTAVLMNGARFKGLEELLSHLDDVTEAFGENVRLRRIAFLVSRSIADFETAVEATLSGYLAVAADAMRDVMEIENLFLDFSIEPENVEEWLTCDDKTRRRKFQPSVVRKRLNAAGIPPFSTTAESVDYRAHSLALHVNPYQFPVARKGITAGMGMFGMASDSGFWEIFEHARRLRLALRRLVGALQTDAAIQRLADQDLNAFEDACQRTQEMQHMFMAFIDASMKVQSEGREEA